MFILVVMSALGAFLVSTSATQNLSLALDVQAARARLAAQAGVDWAAYQVLQVPVASEPVFVSACKAAAGPFPQASAATHTALDIAQGDLPGLPDFRVEAEFSWVKVEEGGRHDCIFDLVLTACSASSCPSATPGLGYAEHRQRTKVLRCVSGC